MTEANGLSASLKRLMEQDPTLMSELKTARDIDRVRDLILRAAERQGLVIDVTALELELAPVAQLVNSLAALEQVMAADPSLEPAVRKAEHVEEAIDLIMASAQRQGVTLDARELVAQIRAFTDQAATGELSDEELADVSGGSLMLAAGFIIGTAILGGVIAGLFGGGYGLGVALKSLKK